MRELRCLMVIGLFKVKLDSESRLPISESSDYHCMYVWEVVFIELIDNILM